MAKTDTEMENMEEQLDDFSWDSTDSNVQLFEEEVVEPLTKEEKEELKQQKDEKSTKKASDKTDEGNKGGDDSKGGKSKDNPEETGGEETVEEPEPFSSSAEETQTSIKDEKQFFKVLATELKEAGVFSNVEIKDDEEIDQEKFIQLQDSEVEARVDETFEAFFKELDEDGKAFLKFKKEGGDTRKFFETLQRGADRPTGDSEDKKHQEKIIRYYLSTYEEMPDDEIDDRIEWLQTTGKLKKSAQVYDKKMTEYEQAMKEQVLADEKLRKDKQEAAKQQFITDIAEALKKTDEVNNIPITKKDKAELLNYITKPAVKVSQNRYVTQFQADLRGLTGKTETLLLLAKLIKNNFDLGDLQRKIETKQTLNIKEKLAASQKGSVIKSSGSSTNKSLSDYF